ncbi:hypothetical protein K1X84_00195 [bacterium]|nr:hypothetical protein [bacterium]
MRILFVVKFIIPIAIFSILACSPSYQAFEPNSTHVLEVVSDSGRNLALLSIPSNYSSSRTWPLFIALHGYGDRADAFLDLWKPAADSLGIIVLVPQGEKAVPGAGWSWTTGSEKNIRMAIDEVQKKIPIASRQIFIGGFSAGGSLSYYLGLKYPHVFSGIVALGASFDPKSLTSIQNSQLLQGKKIYIGHGMLEDNFESSALVAESEFKKLGASISMNPYKEIAHTLPEPKRHEIEKILKFLLDID